MNANWLRLLVRTLRPRKAPKAKPARSIGLVRIASSEATPHYFDRVYVLRSVKRDLIHELKRKPRVETGGVLVGFVDSILNAVVVTGISGPGPKAIHSRYHFNRDAEFCQNFLNRHAQISAGVIDFVGEWHKHPEPDPHPSPQDTTTYRKLAAEKNASTPMPVVLIVGTRSDSSEKARGGYSGVNAFVFSRKGFVQRDVRWLAEDAYLDLLGRWHEAG